MEPFDAAWVDNIPLELRYQQQWVNWVAEPRDGRLTKVPVQPNGRPASSTDRTTWSPFSVCVEAAGRHGYAGIGFVFSADDPYCGIDLDLARDPRTGGWDSGLAPFLVRLASYTEVSPSGHGFHIIVRATLPAGAPHKWYVPDTQGAARPHLELYDRGRYFTMTGNRLGGFPLGVEDRQRLLTEGVLPIITPKPSAAPLRCLGRVPTWGVDTVLRKALEAQNGGKLRELWPGGPCGYGSDSEADLAFCAVLAFWTPDAAVIDAAFRRSGRMRVKWDEPHGAQTYGELTVAQALEGGRQYTTREARTE